MKLVFLITSVLICSGLSHTSSSRVQSRISPDHRVLPPPAPTRIDASQKLSKDFLYPGNDSVTATFALTGQGTPEMPQRKPIDLSLILDNSGSMAGNPSQKSREAARNIVEFIQPQDRAGVVAFTSSAWIVQGLSNDTALIKSKISSIQSASGGTSIDRGITNTGNTAINELPTRIRIVNPATEEVIDTIAVNVSLAIGESRSDSVTWTHPVLLPGNYMLGYDALPPDGSALPLSSGAIVVKKPFTVQASQTVRPRVLVWSIWKLLCRRSELPADRPYGINGYRPETGGSCSQQRCPGCL